MGLKKLFIFIVASCGITSAMAQSTYTDKVGNEYEFRKHAFLNLEGGAQYTLGEAKFDKLISPNVQLGVGYQFNPWLAARIQANAWRSKGGWNGYETAHTGNPYTNDYKYNYVAPGIDVMFNLSNAFFGWNPKRVFNLTAFIGGGANIAWNNDEANAIGKTLKSLNDYDLEYLWDGTKVKAFGRGGLEAAFRVSNAVSIIVEGNANILSDHYNSKKADNPDWYFNALAGLRINLGGTYTKKEKEPEPQPDLASQYVAPQPESTPEPEPEVKKVEPLRRDVFFRINRYQWVASENYKIDDITRFLRENPNAKVIITGYADAGTGNNRINDALSKKRAESVAKALIAKGIAADRITTDSKGSRVQPFTENDKNRVSICIAK